MSVLVTGGTGFLGRHVLRRLLALGEAEVRTLVRRPAPSLERLAERMAVNDAYASSSSLVQVIGDVLEPETLADAMQGVTQVYHLAGFVSRNEKDGPAMMRVHVDGTRHVLEAARTASVERVVVASSSGTIAVSDNPEFMGVDSSPYAINVVKNWPYYLSKIYQEQVAFRFFQEHKIPIVVLSPSLLLGPGDARGSSTEDVRRFLERRIPVVPKGGLNFVDARDAAAAFVSAMHQGQPGQRYLLGGPNWTFEKFFGRLERIAKVRAPKLRLPNRLSRFGAALLEQVADWRGVAASVDRISVEMAEHFWYVDSSKASEELGFEARDPQQTLIDTVRYVRKHFLASDAETLTTTFA